MMGVEAPLSLVKNGSMSETSRLLGSEVFPVLEL